jgi:hypothetical protein
MYGSLNGTFQVSERYAFSSEVLIGLSLVLGLASPAKSTLQKTPAIVLLACFLVSGTLEYVYFHRWLRTELAPDWTTQILAWEGDHSRELFVSPKGWPRFHFALNGASPRFTLQSAPMTPSLPTNAVPASHMVWLIYHERVCPQTSTCWS